MMNIYLEVIEKIEKNTRIAFTKKYPLFLIPILETKRFFRALNYRLNGDFKIRRDVTLHNINLIEHSSPLFRKFNKVELDEGKIENITIAIKKLDGIVIPPGKVFSFWKHIGRPSSKKGYKNGLVLSNGNLKEDIGGGLCQLSNLIAYMFACTECEFIERKHHSRDVFPDNNRAVPFASGATVFFNLIDLKVKNTYKFPIVLKLRTTDTQLRGSIGGAIGLDYNVKIEETDAVFIKSAQGILYRCNTLQRVFYEKHTKLKIKETPLWINVAQVMYDEKEIKAPIFVSTRLSMSTSSKGERIPL